jgi:hypothetical protein
LYIDKKFPDAVAFFYRARGTTEVKTNLGQASLVVFVSGVSIHILKISIAFFFSAEKYYLNRFLFMFMVRSYEYVKCFVLKITLNTLKFYPKLHEIFF